MPVVTSGGMPASASWVQKTWVQRPTERALSEGCYRQHDRICPVRRSGEAAAAGFLHQTGSNYGVTASELMAEERG